MPSPLPPQLAARRRALIRDHIIGWLAGIGGVLILVLAALWGGWSLALGLASLAAFTGLLVVAIDMVRHC